MSPSKNTITRSVQMLYYSPMSRSLFLATYVVDYYLLVKGTCVWVKKQEQQQQINL